MNFKRLMKQLILSILMFALGSYCSFSYIKNKYSIELIISGVKNYEYTYYAYFNSNYEDAREALLSQVNFLIKRNDIPNQFWTSQFVKFNVFLDYARLANIEKKHGDKELYNKYLSLSVEYCNEIKKDCSENDVFYLLEKSDEKLKKFFSRQ